jgi:DHA1 family bicyclomycin/chloramphenicol resistance-like MFS transporter
MAFGQLNRALLRRFDAVRLLGAGLGVGLLGAAVLVGASMTGPGLLPVLVGLFLAVGSVGLVLPNATALALAGQRARAGSASALLGVLQFLFGAVAAPLVGVLGTGTAAPMALLMGALTASAVLTFAVLARRRGRDI